MTARHRRQLVILVTAAFLVFVRADMMLVVSAVLLCLELALQVSTNAVHHRRHA
jgi:hypothetical protein